MNEIECSMQLRHSNGSKNLKLWPMPESHCGKSRLQTTMGSDIWRMILRRSFSQINCSSHSNGGAEPALGTTAADIPALAMSAYCCNEKNDWEILCIVRSRDKAPVAACVKNKTRVQTRAMKARKYFWNLRYPESNRHCKRSLSPVDSPKTPIHGFPIACNSIPHIAPAAARNGWCGSDSTSGAVSRTREQTHPRCQRRCHSSFARAHCWGSTMLQWRA